MEQEMAICDWIEHRNSCDMSPTQRRISGAANFLLAAGLNPPTVSEKWGKRFIDQHPQYFRRKQSH